MKTLKQRYYFSTKTFELSDKKVWIKEKTLFNEKEWEARYNEIGLDLVKFKSNEGVGGAVLFGGLLILTLIMTFKAFTDGTDTKLIFLFLFMSFMWGACFWWQIQNYFAAHFILQGGNKTLSFFINDPTEKTVLVFIDIIRERIKKELKKELTHFDPDMSFEDQLSNLKYLKSINVIEQRQFEEIREELRGRHLIK